MTNSSGKPIAFGSTTAINFVSGQATISGSSNGVMTLYKAGSTTITVTNGGSYNNGAGRTVTVNPTTPNKIVFSTAPPTSGTTGSALTSFAASVEDTYGNVETGSNTGNNDTMTLSVATGPGSIASGGSATASGRVATFSSTILNTAGSYTFTATDDSRSITTATSTAATVIWPGVPNKVVFTVAPPTSRTMNGLEHLHRLGRGCQRQRRDGLEHWQRRHDQPDRGDRSRHHRLRRLGYRLGWSRHLQLDNPQHGGVLLVQGDRRKPFDHHSDFNGRNGDHAGTQPRSSSAPSRRRRVPPDRP